MQVLPSSRYAVSSIVDQYDRNWIVVAMVGLHKEVLELGCSTGFMSRHLVKNGCSVTGVEIDERAAHLAADACSRVEILDLNDAKWISRVGGPFDTVVFGDVLEHLMDPLETLRLSRRLLRDGGYCVVSLPNIAHWTTRLGLLRGRFDYTDKGLLDATHTKFFTLKSAMQLIDDAGFRIVAFTPSIGGKMSGHFRPFWQICARIRPQVFAYQMIFRLASKASN